MLRTLLPGVCTLSFLASVAAAPDYQKQVAPLLKEKCARCHGGARPKGDLDLTGPAGIREAEVVVAGNLKESYLWERVADDSMPPGREKLTDADKQVIKQWIAAGAKMPAGKPAEPKPEAKDPLAPLPTPTRTLAAADLDALFRESLGRESDAGPADAASFLRRVTLDTLGRQPTPGEADAFLGDKKPGRRRRVIEKLLASPEFGQNWGDYWADVIRFQVAPPELTFLDYKKFRAWFAEQLNANRPWGAIARDLLTAKGKVGDNPATVFVAYHQGSPPKLAAETARVFLGVQLRCAECHDHKFDHWKRKQFHNLAAFFARTKAKLTQKRADGTVVKGAKKGEYRMPDPQDPRKPGTLMVPTFLAGQRMKRGRPDAERRAFLADLVTDPTNPWFSAAFVNRVWARLMGRGFYDPVDNMADYQKHHMPKVHAALTEHFGATKLNVKDLFRVILNTEAYQRDLGRWRKPQAAPYGAAVPVRLRGDEVYRSLKRALEVPNRVGKEVKPTKAVRFPPPPKSTRDKIVGAFAFDPSLCPEEVNWNMGQAMLMMNNRELLAMIDASPKSKTPLGRLVNSEADDELVAVKLYRRVLARLPRSEELDIVQRHLRRVGDRRRAFEDLLWALVNSAEFHVRR